MTNVRPVPEIYDIGYASQLTPEQRVALPASWHRPYWDGLGTPQLWHCTVCWDEGWTTQWPCEPATVGGRELSQALGLEYSW